MSEFNHHGIEGQKWGVQNGPPYPLDSSASKQKIKKYTYNRSKVMNSLTDEDMDLYLGLPENAPQSRKNIKKNILMNLLRRYYKIQMFTKKHIK